MNKTDYNLVQSNELAMAKFRLSPLALDIFYTVSMKTSMNDKELTEYKIHRSEIEGYIDKNIAYNDIKNAINSLSSCFINLAARESKKIYNVPMFYSIGFEENIITAKIHPDLNEHFLNLSSRYTTASFIKYISKFKSGYTKRMYLILKSWVSNGQYSTSVESLKDILCVSSDFTYSNFKQRAILKSINDINKLSDLKITFKERKSGRKVTDLTFFIELNEKSEIDEVEKAERKRNKVNKKQLKDLENGSNRNIDIIKMKLWANDNVDCKDLTNAQIMKIYNKSLSKKILETEVIETEVC